LPQNICKTGPVVGIKIMGDKDIPIHISVEDLRKHLYILGQTGTGKTTILYSMMMERIYSGSGICVIDPHGDLYKMLLNNIPQQRLKDLIVIEPGDRDCPIR